MTGVQTCALPIYLKGLKRWAEKNLKESYTRYQALQAAGLETFPEGLVQAIRDALLGADVKGPALELPKNEATDLLVVMATKLAAEFLNNQEHGLDCYLSMRIRHGAFAGQLRAPLEKEHIITQRSSGSDQYTSNVYWRNRVGFSASEWSPFDFILQKIGRASCRERV